MYPSPYQPSLPLSYRYLLHLHIPFSTHALFLYTSGLLGPSLLTLFSNAYFPFLGPSTLTVPISDQLVPLQAVTTHLRLFFSPYPLRNHHHSLEVYTSAFDTHVFLYATHSFWRPVRTRVATHSFSEHSLAHTFARYKKSSPVFGPHSFSDNRIQLHHKSNYAL
jgi:hypothetical protein